MSTPRIDEDLTVIEHLDFEAGCEQDGCDSTADFYVSAHYSTCGCKEEGLVCRPCLDALRSGLDRRSTWCCAKCRKGYVGRGTDFWLIDRIEPLR